MLGVSIFEKTCGVVITILLKINKSMNKLIKIQKGLTIRVRVRKKSHKRPKSVLTTEVHNYLLTSANHHKRREKTHAR